MQAGKLLVLARSSLILSLLAAGDLLKLPGYRQPKDQDLAEAKRLLAEAGFEKGFKTKFLARARYTDDLAVLMKQQLAPIGIDVDVTIQESASFLDQLRQLSFPMYGYPMATRSLDPDDMSVFFTSTGGTNRTGLKDPQVDSLFDKQSRTVDAGERKKVVRELEAKLLDLSPVVVVYWIRGNVAHYPELKNCHRGMFFNNKYEDVWLAK